MPQDWSKRKLLDAVPPIIRIRRLCDKLQVGNQLSEADIPLMARIPNLQRFVRCVASSQPSTESNILRDDDSGEGIANRRSSSSSNSFVCSSVAARIST